MQVQGLQHKSQCVQVCNCKTVFLKLQKLLSNFRYIFSCEGQAWNGCVYKWLTVYPQAPAGPTLCLHLAVNVGDYLTSLICSCCFESECTVPVEEVSNSVVTERYGHGTIANPLNHLVLNFLAFIGSHVMRVMLRPFCTFTDLHAESQSEHLGFAVGGKCANTVRKSVMTQEDPGERIKGTHCTRSWGFAFRFPLTEEDGSRRLCSQMELAPLP